MKQKTAVLFATWFGSGLIPPVIVKGMAGTYGSLCSIPLCCLAIALGNPKIWHINEQYQWTLYFMIIIAIMVIGFVTIPATEKALGPREDWGGKIKRHDQNQIVIDEVFGMLIACLPLAVLHTDHIHAWHIAVAFVSFRFFDITKPPPVRYFDRWDDEVGVMMDDGIAGLYAAIVLAFVLLAST